MEWKRPQHSPAVASRFRSAAAGAPASAVVGGVGPLGLGVTMLWLSVIVLLPLAALTVKALDGGPERHLGRDHRPGGARRRWF